MSKNISQLKVLQYCVDSHIPFVAYKLPNTQKKVLLIARKAKEINIEGAFTHTADSFVICPFDVETDASISIEPDYEISTDTVPIGIWEDIKTIECCKEHNADANISSNFSEYQQNFGKLHAAIANGNISKAILSRVKYISNFGQDKASIFFDTLCSTFPKAYTFMYYAPQCGLWTGASPEQLYLQQNNIASIVALAGTKAYNKNIATNWSAKEINEQQIVGEYIEQLLNKYNISPAKKSETTTINVGKVSHLHTLYQFNSLLLHNNIANFILDLHPTPAVCGFPKHKAFEVIKSCEQHKRTYYSGFVGRIQTNNIQLFVNIRCMKFVNNGVDLYLGGGITIDSECQMEWNETELKAQTLLQIIEKVQNDTNNI